MNNPDLKPDLGVYLLDKFGEKSEQNFYAVKIFHLIYVDRNTFSFTSNTFIDNKEYAASFDFDTIQFERLLSQIEDQEFSSFLNSKLKKEFIAPEKVDFYNTPIVVNVVGKLGVPIKSLYETFVPIIVSKFGKIEHNEI